MYTSTDVGCGLPIRGQYYSDWFDAGDSTATVGVSFFIVLTNVFGVFAALHADWVTGVYIVQVND